MATAVKDCMMAEAKRERNASAPCLPIGEQVRGNHSLAVARPCRMKNAVHKRDTDNPQNAEPSFLAERIKPANAR